MDFQLGSSQAYNPNSKNHSKDLHKLINLLCIMCNGPRDPIIL